MNYRHAFHAGNFADCMKHALLVWLLRALFRKPAPVFVLDTHAGRGRYDLTAGPAERTGEWRAGIARLLDDPPAVLADYVGLVRAEGLYPGSPALIRALLREADRLACCELHPEDCAALKIEFGRDAQVAVHRRDAWEALGALLPPRERRALVLIDPPYEEAGEFGDLVAGLRAGWSRFRGGVFAAWYPIKHRAPVRAFHAALAESGIRDIVAAELWLREPLDPGRLNGCGLVVVNPPYGFETAAADILAALLDRLGAHEPGEGTAMIRLVDE
jgi:23S rRNA (adenine2030-N6)-methyltransferase